MSPCNLQQTNRDCRDKRQQGMTLVELMIAMVISLILIGGTIQLFISNKQTYRVTEASSRLQENARFAVMFLTSDIRMTGFWGCANVAGPDDDATGTKPDFASGGLSATEGAGGTPDNLTLRGATPSNITVTSAGGTNLTVSSTAGLAAGDVAIVSDCSGANAFTVSNIGSATTITSTAGLTNAYGTDAMLYSAREYLYSIQNNASGEPSLYRTITGGATEELVEGIEDMQILYGEDTGTDSVADYYVSAGSVSDMNNVVSIRITLVARSTDNITSATQAHSYDGSTDNRLRRTFTTTIGVRNRL